MVVSLFGSGSGFMRLSAYARLFQVGEQLKRSKHVHHYIDLIIQVG